MILPLTVTTMVIHKRTRLTPVQRKEPVQKYYGGIRICDLCRHGNKRFRCLEYGLKRLAKVEQELEEKLN